MRRSRWTSLPPGITGWLLLGLLACDTPNDGRIDSSFIHLPGESADDPAPHMAWSATHLDLGVLAAGEHRTLTFTVTNDGQAPMLIAQVVPSCGCTVAEEWDTAPIPPGESRDIQLAFDAGETTRTLNEKATVVTNAVPASIELTFAADVLGPDRAPEPEP